MSRAAKVQSLKSNAERVESILSDLERAPRPKIGPGMEMPAETNSGVSPRVKNVPLQTPLTHSEAFPQADPIQQTMCTGKIRYDDKRNARTKINELKKRRGVSLRPYPCPYCHGWHLTKSV